MSETCWKRGEDPNTEGDRHKWLTSCHFLATHIEIKWVIELLRRNQRRRGNAENSHLMIIGKDGTKIIFYESNRLGFRTSTK